MYSIYLIHFISIWRFPYYMRHTSNDLINTNARSSSHHQWPCHSTCLSTLNVHFSSANREIKLVKPPPYTALSLVHQSRQFNLLYNINWYSFSLADDIKMELNTSVNVTRLILHFPVDINKIWFMLAHGDWIVRCAWYWTGGLIHHLQFNWIYRTRTSNRFGFDEFIHM